MWTVLLFETRKRQKNFSEDELVNTNEESGDKRYPRRSDGDKKVTLKKLQEILYITLKGQRMPLEAGLHLEISITIWQSITKMFRQYYKLYHEKKASTAQTNLDKFFFYQK